MRLRSAAAGSGFEQRQLALAAAFGNLDGIFAGEAGVAETGRLMAVKGVQPFPTQVAQRIGADEAADFLDRLMRSEQLLAGGRVDTVKARMGGGRRGNPHVDLAC